MQTVTLELLRHGEAHNQLLSPLTQYLALCENHSAVTVHVPFEHNQMLHRLRALSYAMGEEPREFQVKDTAKVLGDLLSGIPGLTADMNRGQRDERHEPIFHLRLVLSASELALLPFELSLAPNGFPGAGQPLLLQSQTPLCITRETRRVPAGFVQWPDRPRILFVSATPPGYEAVPAVAHLLALRKALEPWIGAMETDDADQQRKLVAPHLSVLTNASIEAIQEACTKESFTHIHILAHGHEYKAGYDVRFGLALHDAADPLGPPDIVSGARLATALRVPRRGDIGALSRPAVVTLASCHGGNVGTVIGAGASVAHALHEEGIPLVIASQFPLSFGGSVRMVQTLYEGLLWGEDPRRLLIDLRRQLHTQFPATHDWASITAYASLPPGFEKQLASAQIRRAHSSFGAAKKVADEVTERFSSRIASRTKITPDEKLLASTRARVVAAKKRLEGLLARYPDERARIAGLLAGTEKREAEVHYSRRNVGKLSDEQRKQARQDALDALLRAHGYYWSAFLAGRAEDRLIVQYLSLTLLLEKCGVRLVAETSRQDAEALWCMAEMQSKCDLSSDDRGTRIWAFGNLLELYILAPLVNGVNARYTEAQLAEAATGYAREMVAASGSQAYGVWSTRRQVARYLEWYSDLTNQGLGAINTIAEKVFDALPECDEPDWDV